MSIYVDAVIKQRFWDKVQKNSGLWLVVEGKRISECWLWKGARKTAEYGNFWNSKKFYLAHRFSFFLANGFMPDDQVLHKCDRPPCIRPDHLFEGTSTDNVRDMMKKGRHAWARPGWGANNGIKGSENPTSKLTEKKVVEIRRLHSEKVPQSVIAGKFAVSRSTICLVVNKKIWTHVGGAL